MDEKDLNQRLHGIFSEILPALESMREGFWAESQRFLEEADKKLRWVLTSNLPFAEELVKKEDKDELEKKYVILLPHLQLIAILLRKLADEMKKKIEADLLFTDKAIEEIKELYALLYTLFGDIRDYILTGNSHLRVQVKREIENLYERANEYSTRHETRLITGVCMPKASYAYIAIVDCIKGVSRELSSFSEKL